MNIYMNIICRYMIYMRALCDDQQLKHAQVFYKYVCEVYIWYMYMVYI